MLDRFDRALSMLASHPSAGRARPELGHGIRSMVVGSYVLFYSFDGETLTLVRARSGYTDIGPDDVVRGSGTAI